MTDKRTLKSNQTKITDTNLAINSLILENNNRDTKS